MTFIIREAEGPRFSENLVLGPGLALGETVGGVPELLGAGGATYLHPSGGDDTLAIAGALAAHPEVRLAPGTFLVGDTLVVGEGRILRGSGSTRTTLQAGHGGSVIGLGTGGVAGLSIEGPGSSTPGSTGIGIAPSFTGGEVRLHDVRISHVQDGVFLDVRRAGLSDVVVTDVAAAYGIRLDADLISMENVEVSAPGGIGIEVSVREAGSIRSIRVRDCATGMRATGIACSLDGYRATGCDVGLALENAGGWTAGAIEAVDCALGVLIHNTNACSVSSLRVGNAARSLELIDSSDTVIGTCHSALRFGGTSSDRHLLITSSARAFFTSFQVVNGFPLPTFEVDVSAAGGRVLFGPNNFASARINSGGNYAAL